MSFNGSGFDFSSFPLLSSEGVQVVSTVVEPIAVVPMFIQGGTSGE